MSGRCLRRGRPTRDLLSLAEQVHALLVAEPQISTNEVTRRVQARRHTVKRLVAILRPAATDPAPESFPHGADAGTAAHDLRTRSEEDS
jgi:hypothetical protein